MLEKIVVLAKTYPEKSKKYGALVCTAGINEQGDFRRLYPVPWNQFFKGNPAKFSKWDIIAVDTTTDGLRDHREESRKVVHPHMIRSLSSITTKKQWADRIAVMNSLDNTSLCEVQRTQRAAERPLEKTLCMVTPRKVNKLLAKPRDCITDEGEVNCMDGLIQTDLYGNRLPSRLPWVGFTFTCDCADCKGHRMMCIDWEFQELYRREGEDKAREKLEWLKQRDLRFICGTIWNHPFSWVVVSLLYPPKM
ncbi:MAG TPA: hypothetical protein PLQ01_09860 [Methanothrix sp.]|nr:hypothetical protein [Methanothrix sp.]